MWKSVAIQLTKRLQSLGAVGVDVRQVMNKYGVTSMPRPCDRLKVDIHQRGLDVRLVPSDLHSRVLLTDSTEVGIAKTQIQLLVRIW